MDGTLIGRLRNRLFVALLRGEESNDPQKYNDFVAAMQIAEWGKANGVDPATPHFAADVLVVFLRDKGLRDDDIDKASLSELASFLDSPIGRPAGMDQKHSVDMVGPLSRKEWAKRFGRSVTTFDRWRSKHLFRWDAPTTHHIRIHRDDVQRLEKK